MIFNRYSKALLAAAALLIVASQPAAAQYSSDVPQQVINNTVQTIIQNVRDQLQRRKIPASTGRLQFNGEEGEFNSRDPFAVNGMGNPFGALAYAKAPAMAVGPAAQWLYGANLVSSADKAVSLNTEIHTWTVTGAFDITKIGIFTATDALTFIGTGSHTWSRQYSAPPEFEGSIPSTSGTLSYLNGGFSADFTFLASWTRNSLATTPPPPLVVVAPANSSSASYTGNAQYRFDFPYSIWYEPTAGVTYTELYTANFGTKVADTTEVHGGGRVGTEMKWMGFTVQPTLSGQVYKIVDARNAGLIGPNIPAVPLVFANLGGRGSAKITVLWTQNFSSYLEAHGSGTAGTQNTGFNPATQIYGAQAGLRYTW
jgi:hypothetical protein